MNTIMYAQLNSNNTHLGDTLYMDDDENDDDGADNLIIKHLTQLFCYVSFLLIMVVGLLAASRKRTIQTQTIFVENCGKKTLLL